MQTAEQKAIAVLEAELKFMRRHLPNVHGEGREDFETLDEIGMSLESAAQALEELKLALQPACEEIPAGVPLVA